MSITNEALALVLRDYLARYPGDRDRLGPFLRAAEARAAGSARLTSSRTLPGHVACSMVALNGDGQVLQVRHRVDGPWLPPAGHVEDRDYSLYGAALRELAEETGLGRRAVRPLVNFPVDVDIQWVGAAASRREPEHVHYEFRFVAVVSGAAGAWRASPRSPGEPPAGTTSVFGWSPPNGGAAGRGTPGAVGGRRAGEPTGPPAVGSDGRLGGGTGGGPLGRSGGGPGSPPDLGLSADDESVGARWGALTDLEDRLAQRVATVLGRSARAAR